MGDLECGSQNRQKTRCFSKCHGFDHLEKKDMLSNQLLWLLRLGLERSGFVFSLGFPEARSRFFGVCVVRLFRLNNPHTGGISERSCVTPLRLYPECCAQTARSKAGVVSRSEFSISPCIRPALPLVLRSRIWLASMLANLHAPVVKQPCS